MYPTTKTQLTILKSQSTQRESQTGDWDHFLIFNFIKNLQLGTFL